MTIQGVKKTIILVAGSTLMYVGFNLLASTAEMNTTEVITAVYQAYGMVLIGGVATVFSMYIK